ncbi:MAG TPA: hypothetical protein VJ742_13240 [Nitrososphaera sp.]|nr:hypothetical protein [Nitrososphaera sp.]
MSDEFEAPPQVSIVELEAGIFNLVINLVQQHAQTMPQANACEQVASYLERIVASLRLMNGEPKADA